MERKEKIVVISLIILGFILRIWRLRELMGFDYDQEVAALAIDKILSGKPTLIGQEISIGGIFIGPFYYYLLAVFYFLFGRDPIGAGVMVALISIATMTVLYQVAKILVNQKAALIALLIYITSSQIIFYDRTTAPSNPVMLFSLLTAYLLLKIKQGKTKLYPLLWLIAATATIHFHPSAIVLFPTILFFSIVWKKQVVNWRFLTTGFTMILLAASPLLIFDIRHSFLNSEGVITSISTLGTEAYTPIFKFLTLARIQVQNTAALFSNDKIGALIAVIVFTSFLYTKKESQKKFIIPWIILPILVFSFYSRHIPEYYLLPSLPIIIIMIAIVLERIVNSKSLIGYTLLFGIAIINLFQLSQLNNPYGLLHKQQAVKFISQQKSEKIAVSFDTDLGLEAGIKYLLERENLSFASETLKPTHTIVIPKSRKSSPGKEQVFGGVKVIESVSTNE